MKKLLIIALAAALAITLNRTNPDIGDFIYYYEGGTWMEEEALLDKLPGELETLKESIREVPQEEIRKDYYVASLYHFGNCKFLGIAGGFHLLAQ